MPPQDVSKKLVPVYMDELDGDGFTDHMVRVNEKLGYDDVKRTQKGPDGGKDIVMYKGRDLYYMECKHWRDKHVGRPEVQKLDSAAHRAGASHAFMVASGLISSDAVEYCNQMVGMTVELIDRDKLIGLNEEAGYRLIFGDEEVDDTIYCCREAPAGDVRKKLRKLILDRVLSEGSDEKLPLAGGSLLMWYEPFYCLYLVLPEADDCPFARAEGTKPVWTSVWVEAGYPIGGESEDPRDRVHLDRPDDANAGHLLKGLYKWDDGVAMAEGLMSFDFKLTLEEALALGTRYARQLAEDRGLPVDSVSVRQVYTVMMPVYMLVAETYRQTRRVAAIFTKGPIVLDRDGMVRD